MNKIFLSSLIALATAALLFADKPREIELDWSPAWRSGIREVCINRETLHKLAGVSPDTGFTVYAEKADKRTALDTVHYAGSNKESVILRFTVPEGTEKLFCRTGAKNIRTADAVRDNNIFAGALDKENIKRWQKSKHVTVSASKNGVILKSSSFGNVQASFTVDVPEEAAGSAASLELDVRGLSPMVWGNNINVIQLDAKGKDKIQTNVKGGNGTTNSIVTSYNFSSCRST